MERENKNLKLEAQELAKQILAEFGTDNVIEIAEKSAVKIVYEKWFPTTIGEFDRKNKTITVNLNARESFEKIIAHELGHFFAQNLDLEKAEEEIFCGDFANALVENKI